MFLQRQISAVTGNGEKTSVADMPSVVWRLNDILPKYTLVLADGDWTSDYIKLDSADTYTVQLPANYTNASRLSCCFRSTAVVKLTVVSPTHGTSNFLLKGTNGTTDGDHKGIIMWQGDVTSILLTAAADALVDYCLFKVPDLTDADSYQLGQRALGVASE